MPEEISLPGCDSDSVFADVTRRAQSPATRTLWSRLREEMRRAGVSGAASYLEGEFTRLNEELEAELKRHESGE